ncbi:MAG: phosphotransferase [Deltaproteobacteria bacterium]|nr:phosphotransferase [Deltaproteobacteria bacterium]
MAEEQLVFPVAWARAHWPGGDPGPLEVTPLPLAGSDRTFVRLSAPGRGLVGLYSPHNLPESRAWGYFARHLAGLGLPVARVLAADPGAGLFLMEDLGRETLTARARDLVREDPAGLAGLYRPVLEALAAWQARGREGLDLAYCFDSRELDAPFLAEREAGYFAREYLGRAQGLAPEAWPEGLAAELTAISRRAGTAGPRVLVHRDFQSSNVVLGPDGRPGLVDFQGARLGPAQYDPASLLHDPYVDLPWESRAALLELFLSLRESEPGFDRAGFLAGWLAVSLSRVMQALGAYAFLSLVRGRGAFAAHARPARATLTRLLNQAGGYPVLASLLDRLPPWPLEDPL